MNLCIVNEDNPQRAQKSNKSLFRQGRGALFLRECLRQSEALSSWENGRAVPFPPLDSVVRVKLSHLCHNVADTACRWLRHFLWSYCVNPSVLLLPTPLSTVSRFLFCPSSKTRHPSSLLMQRATAIGNWWLAASSWQCPHSCTTSWCRVFWQNIKSHSACIQPRFGALQLLVFPKTKITFEREEISDHLWDSGKYDGAVDGDWENWVRFPRLTLKGTEASLSYVQCFLYLLQ